MFITLHCCNSTKSLELHETGKCRSGLWWGRQLDELVAIHVNKARNKALIRKLNKARYSYFASSRCGISMTKS